MTSKSKNKGSAYERGIAKFLSEHYNAQFCRNISGSGAYVGGSNRFRKATLSEAMIRHTKGDVVPPEEYGLLNIECKSYANFEFHHLLSECKLLETWIKQLLDASDENDVNILFFKITRRGQYVAVQSSLDWIATGCYSRYTSEKFGEWLIFDHDKFFQLNSDRLTSLAKPVIIK